MVVEASHDQERGPTVSRFAGGVRWHWFASGEGKERVRLLLVKPLMLVVVNPFVTGGKGPWILN